MSSSKKVAVVGCGYVGITTAVVLANCGYSVHAVEVNPERLKILQSGKSFFYEVGVNELLAKGVESQTLRFSDDIAGAASDADIVFSCVGTPDNPDGSSNLTYVFTSAEQVATHAKDGVIFVQKSTVPVGTGERVEAVFAKAGKQVRYVSNPEFLREGTAIFDTLWFDRAVAGSNDQEAAQAVLDVYRTVESNQKALAEIAGVGEPKPGDPTRYFEANATEVGKARYVLTNRNSAELIKVSANAFLALKISFANSIAQLADAADANVVAVMDAVGADKRIGRAFLNAGRGYGGGCFPKDVDGLIHSAAEHGIDMTIMKAAAALNSSMADYVISRAQNAFGNPLEGVRIAVLGASFKPGTSDTRRSPAIAIANKLAGMGANVSVYDPVAMEEAEPEFAAAITRATSVTQAVEGVACVFIATEWPEFVTEEALNTYRHSGATLIVDCMNAINSPVEGVQVVGVGR